MVRLVKTILTVGLLVAGSVGSSYANGEVNNIWWNVIINYNNSGQTVCLAEQFNNEMFAAVTFDVYPVPGHPGHGTATQRWSTCATPTRSSAFLRPLRARRVVA